MTIQRMKIAGIFDKYTGDIFKFLGVKVRIVSPDQKDLESVVESLIKEFKSDKDIFAVVISKNISSKVRSVIENFILYNERPFVVEIDPAIGMEKYESYEAIIKKVVRETIGIRI